MLYLRRLVVLSIVLPLLVVAARAGAVTLLLDFNNGATPTQTGFDPIAAPWSGTFGSINVGITPVGAAALDGRDRGTGNGGGAEAQMWQDFLFANGSPNPGDGVNIDITGLAPNTAYPVRLWAFDDSSNGGRTAKWNNVPLTFPTSPDPASLNDYVANFNIHTDAAGAAQIQGRASINNGQPHHVFVNGLEIGDPLAATAFPIQVDIQATGGVTQPGFTPWEFIANGPPAGSVSVSGVTFAMDPTGARNRALDGGSTGNALQDVLRDLTFTDNMVELTISDLPAGAYTMTTFHWDDDDGGADEIFDIFVSDAKSSRLAVDGLPEGTRGLRGHPFTVISNGSPITVRFEEVDTDGAGPDDQRNVTLNGFTLVEGAVPQQPRFLQYAIDIGTSESATEPGFTALNAELGEVSVGQTSFAVFSADGARNRAGANALTTDFVFDDGDGGAVGVQVFDLPDGVWQAEVWAWDDSVAMGDMIVGITQFQHAPEMIFTDSFTPDPNQPFTFTFDSRDLIDGFGIFTRENNDPLFRSRFNALRLTQIIPEPATASLLALGAVVLLRRRRRVA